jgi:HAE1 family hydrophobic/amphiphilic exporter-1
LQIYLTSLKSELLKSYGETLAKFMSTLPQVRDATTSSKDRLHEFHVIPSGIKSALMNVDSKDITDTLQLLFDGIKVGKFNNNGGYLDIKMQLGSEENHTLSDLNSVLIPTQNGKGVLLSSIARIEQVLAEPVIEHLNGEKVLTVKANYSGQDLAGVTNQIQDYLDKTMPLDIAKQLSGQSSDLQDMLSTFGMSLILAVIFVFMVLSIQFENMVAPLSILFSIPFAFSGAFIALLITRNPLCIYSMIGIIMLMGLVTKNAILLIEFAQQKIKKENYSIEKALIEAAKMRLRPILMTTITMIAGMLPMALSSGEGSEIRANIAVTVIGGLISSTFLTLLIVPCAYLSLMRIFKLSKKDTDPHF